MLLSLLTICFYNGLVLVDDDNDDDVVDGVVDVSVVVKAVFCCFWWCRSCYMLFKLAILV